MHFCIHVVNLFGLVKNIWFAEEEKTTQVKQAINFTLIVMCNCIQIGSQVNLNNARHSQSK